VNFTPLLDRTRRPSVLLLRAPHFQRLPTPWRSPTRAGARVSIAALSRDLSPIHVP